MDVNEHERLSNITLKTQIKVKEHERLSNITLRHKLKYRNTRDYTTLHLDTN